MIKSHATSNGGATIRNNLYTELRSAALRLYSISSTPFRGLVFRGLVPRTTLKAFSYEHRR